MSRYRTSRTGCCSRSCCETSKTMPVLVVRGYGSINSTGVLPAGQECASSITEVEFSLNVHRIGRTYEGDIYLVDYDTREKINSNRLVYFEQCGESQVMMIFVVECGNGNCAYEMVVTASTRSCKTNANGTLFAYVPAICNEGLNIGGTLKQGEIIICGSECCCGCSPHHIFATRGSIIDEIEEEESCTFYDTAPSTSGCCAGRTTSAQTSTTTSKNTQTNTQSSTRTTSTSSNSQSTR